MDHFSSDGFRRLVDELNPVLLAEARKICRPCFVGPDDLVQEAWAHIFKNRKCYDANKSSVKTWCVTVAKRRFYNVATSLNRKKRHPKDENGDSQAFCEFDDTTLPRSMTCQNDGEANLLYEELIKRTRVRLKPFAKKVFDTLMEPDRSIIHRIRLDHIVKNWSVDSGRTSKRPFAFSITNYHLSDELGVTYTAIIKAKDDIHDAIHKAASE